MPYTTTTRVTYVHKNDKMCFRDDPSRKYYYHEEYVPVRQVAHGHHHHHHRSSPTRVSYHSSTARHSHYSSASPRVSTSSYRVAGAPVVYQERTRETRYH
ncbi:hypothetical protein F5X99DRAFT_408173 [Biscogniauxia marginata]|nr:hypothetical protein F5X99DRAFT_408173 [Biscogniauxia marginata]